MKIFTEPGTTILWDGIPLGTSDESGHMTISNIPPGRYSVAFRHDGFESVTKQLDIAAGNQTLEVLLVADVGAGLTPALPAPVPAFPVDAESDGSNHAIDPTLPDPFARQSNPLLSIVFVAFLVAIAAGALWLGRRRRQELGEEVVSPQPDGPRVFLTDEPRGHRRPPGFYEELRHRETVLENLEERGPHRPRPKIIELPVVDHRPVEEDR